MAFLLLFTTGLFPSQGAAQWPGLGLLLVQGSGVGTLCGPGGFLTAPGPQEAPGPCYSIFGVEITLRKKP